MLIDLDSLDKDKTYHLLMQSVVPRPIAWVLTDNGTSGDAWNLAPFSMFQVVSTNPPLLVLSIGTRGLDADAHKDTWENISRRQGLTVHVASFDLLDPVVKSSSQFPRGVSEVSSLGLDVTEVDGWPTPRLTAAPLAFSCEKEFCLEVGPDPQRIVFCRVHQVWAHDQVAAVIPDKEDRLVLDAAAINPIARLGGALYGQIGNLTEARRPF